MIDLNTLIDPLSGWELLDGSDINDAGQITGQGLINDEYHAYLLTPVPVLGDFNHDGSANAADYVTWRKGLGTSYTSEQYSIWRTNFGQTVGSGAALPSAELLSAAVPEPASLALLALGLPLLAGRKSRRLNPISCASRSW